MIGYDLGLHAFTGCDSVSCFGGKGKVKPIKILEKSETFQEAIPGKFHVKVWM